MTREGFGILTTPFYRAEIQRWFLKEFYIVEHLLNHETFDEKETTQRAYIESHILWLTQYRKRLSNVDVKEMLKGDIEAFGYHDTVFEELYDLLMDIITSVDSVEKIPSDVNITDDVLGIIHSISDNVLTISHRRIVAKQPIIFEYNRQRYFEIKDGSFNQSPDTLIKKMMESDDIYNLYEALEKTASELNDKRNTVEYVLNVYREPIKYIDNIPTISLDDIAELSITKTKKEWLTLIKQHEKEIDAIPFLSRHLYFMYDENGQCYLTYQGCDYLSYDIKNTSIRESFRSNYSLYFSNQDIEWYHINNPSLRTEHYIENIEHYANIYHLEQAHKINLYYQKMLKKLLKTKLEVKEIPSSVYIIKEESNGYYKIGVSKNVQARLKQLKTGNPNKLTIIYEKAFPDERTAYRIESKCHRMMEEKCIYREWFELSKDDLNEVIQYLNQKIASQ